MSDKDFVKMRRYDLNFLVLILKGVDFERRFFTEEQTYNKLAFFNRSPTDFFETSIRFNYTERE